MQIVIPLISKKFDSFPSTSEALPKCRVNPTFCIQGICSCLRSGGFLKRRANLGIKAHISGGVLEKRDKSVFAARQG